MERTTPLAPLIAVLLGGCVTTSLPPSARLPSLEPPSEELPAAVRSGEPYAPVIDPADFVTTVDNPYFPLVPGTRWVLRGSGDARGEVDEIEVLSETRTVMGVVCVVVRDVVSEGGEPVEVTDDWYAQDAGGNVWYFGEETAEYENGEVVSTSGSWEAGVDGAQPGIIMPGDPRVGMRYHQEFYAGEAEDQGEIIEIGASARVPVGTYGDVLVTEDWTPLEPDIRERKYYAPGVGLIRERQTTGGSDAFELIEFEEP
jgi:hypothetical protein